MLDAVREVALGIPVSLSYDKIMGDGFDLRRATDSDGSRYDQITVWWSIPQPSGGMHRLSVDLPRAMTDELKVTTANGEMIVDAIFDAARDRAEEVFASMWGLK